MSIISEALKRAHIEAVRQDRVQARLYRTPGVADYPTRESRRRVALALLATNAALVGIVGFMVWSRREAPLRSASARVIPDAPRALPAPAPSIVAAVPVAPKEQPREAPKVPSPSAVVSERDGLVAGRSYSERLTSKRGEELVLSGITIAGDRGAALMNGKVLWEGERIGSFVVNKVARDRVELQYRDIVVYLRLP